MCSEDQRRGHRESAGSSEADDGEGAEVDSALLVRDRGLVLLLGASLGLLLDLDLERAELVVPSKEAVVLRRGGGGGLVVLEHVLFELGGRSPSKTQGLGLGL